MCLLDKSCFICALLIRPGLRFVFGRYKRSLILCWQLLEEYLKFKDETASMERCRKIGEMFEARHICRESRARESIERE